MQAVLHIGTEKTGTTTFQTFMSKNRQILAEQGVFYPETLGNDNHRLLASYCLNLSTADETLSSLHIATHDELNAFYLMIEDRLDLQIRKAKENDTRLVLFSSEHLHSRLQSTEQITRVYNLLSRYFEHIEVYVHLRPQVDVLTSLASTQTRVGGSVRKSFFDRARNDRMYFNYDMLVAAWEDVFGSDNLHCVAFNDTPDFLKFLCSRIGLDLDGLDAPQRVNEALDVRVMAMVNALVDSGSTQRIDFRVLDQLPVEQKLQLDIGTARQIQHRFEESNRQLISRRRDLSPGQLQPKWKRYPENGNVDILQEKCVFSEMLAHLIMKYHELIGSR